MAESAVSFLLDQLAVFLCEEKQLLGGLEREVEFIRNEMGQMNEFLRFADQNHESNPIWITQFREIAYDVEDVLDKYMLRFGRRHVAHGFKKAYAYVKNLKARREIASEIQSIKIKLQNFSNSQQRYKDMYAAMDPGSSSVIPSNEVHDSRGDALFLDEDEVVGIEEPKKQLVEWIESRGDGLEVISVVGMGGLGKTTLVKKVYDSESVRRNFDHHVWVVASDNKDANHLLASLITKLVGELKEPPPQNLKDMSENEMRDFIFEFLRRKNYIIVIDDVWNINAWNAVRCAFPKRDNHSCVIITTRSYSIGNDACKETNHVYELEPLPEEESRELFHKKAFPRNPCPHHIREYAEKILKRCRGLPLAISVIGGLLATKNNSSDEEWEMLEKSFSHELRGEGYLQMLGKSMSLSYNDLPYYLKYCYLYLSIFPEDALLEKETIIRLWIAEGFVQRKHDMTMEEVAVGYLNDLNCRSLIQVAKRQHDGRVRAFRIHDLLRDYIISKSREHNIVTTGEMQYWPSRIRRLAIQKPLGSPQEAYSLERLRSLVLECSENVAVSIIRDQLGRCRLLKVLELRGAPLESIPEEVFKLYYLKYLSLRSTKVEVISKSIKYLVNLETLDLKNCYVTELPLEILNLSKLRHLLVYRYKMEDYLRHSFQCMQSFKGPCEIGRSFPCLLKLCDIDANESNGMKIVREIGKLTQLRRLGITKLRSEDGKELCSSIVKLTNLRSLRIQSVEEGEKLDLDYSVNLPFLRKLGLCGWLEKVPEWIRSLQGLTTLILNWSRLREDPLNSLEHLSNLAVLQIHGAYIEGLRFKAHAFHKLKVLNLIKLECMKRVIVEKGSMPSLEKWYIWDCKMLMELPHGIHHLPHLQLLSFVNAGDEFVESYVEERRIGGDNWRLSHVPIVNFWHRLDDGILIRRQV